jgi:hypothetical protein
MPGRRPNASAMLLPGNWPICCAETASTIESEFF